MAEDLSTASARSTVFVNAKWKLRDADIAGARRAVESGGADTATTWAAWETGTRGRGAAPRGGGRNTGQSSRMTPPLSALQVDCSLRPARSNALWETNALTLKSLPSRATRQSNTHVSPTRAQQDRRRSRPRSTRAVSLVVSRLLLSEPHSSRTCPTAPAVACAGLPGSPAGAGPRRVRRAEATGRNTRRPACARGAVRPMPRSSSSDASESSFARSRSQRSSARRER